MCAPRAWKTGSSTRPGLLGMQLVDKTRNSLALAHGRPQAAPDRQCRRRRRRRLLRLRGRETPPRSTPTRRVSTTHGVKVARGARALADERCVTDLIVFSDPAGNRLEVFHGPQLASDPFKPGRVDFGLSHRPARDGPCGAHHRARRGPDAVLSRRARLPPQRLLPAAVQGLFLPSQSAPPHASASSRPASSASTT